MNQKQRLPLLAHQMDMPQQQQHVRYWGDKRTYLDAARGPSWTRSGRRAWCAWPVALAVGAAILHEGLRAV
jgi:hypothetical protein